MHYFKFDIKAYLSHTSHLDDLEDLAYRRMMEWCYLHEEPLPKDINKIAKIIRMRTQCVRIASVLQEFWNEEDEGYFDPRINADIAAYRGKSAKSKAAADARWAKKSLKDKQLGSNRKLNANALQEHSERNANNELLITNNELNIRVKTLLEYFNKITGRKFKTGQGLKSRAKDYTDEDIKLVIDYKTKQWKGTSNEKYLRPETLFRESKFESYYNDMKTNVPEDDKEKGPKPEWAVIPYEFSAIDSWASRNGYPICPPHIRNYPDYKKQILQPAIDKRLKDEYSENI